MAASCSTLLTKAEFEAYKALNDKKMKALEDALGSTLKKGQESDIVSSALKNPGIIAFLLGALGFDSMKNSINSLNNSLKATENIANTAKREASKASQDTIDARKEYDAKWNEASRKQAAYETAQRATNQKVAGDAAKASQEAASAKQIANTASSEAKGASSTAKSALGKAGEALGKANKAIGELPGIKQLAQLARSDAAQALFKVLGIISIVFSIFDLLNTFATFESVNAALNTADIARSTANQAYLEAYNAKSQARDASGKSDLAIARSNQAINEAQDAQNRATDAIGKAGLAEAKAINATNAANNANNTATEALSTANSTKAEVSDLKSQVRSLSAGLSSLNDRLSDLAANQSLQSVELKKALYELSRLETLVAVLEGEIEGLGEPSLDTVRINALNALITEARDTATKAFQLAERGIQLAANKGAGEFAAQLQSQLTTLKSNFESQTRTTTNQINQLGDRVSQVEQSASEQTKLSPPQIEQVKQISSEQIKTITPEIVKQNSMTPKEFEALQTSSNEKLINFLVPALTIALLPQLLPKLDSINKNTQDIKNKPTKDCLAPVYVPPVDQKVNQNLTATTALHSYTAVQTTAIKADTTSINVQTTQVNAKTSAIQSIANNTLTKVGEVASSITKLYRFLGIDRWINYVNMALLLHNALMLSNNLGQTAISAVENVFQLFGLKLQDDKGQEIDLSTLVGKTIQDTAKAVLGNENYTALTTNWKKANRIYQTGMNVLYSVQSIGNSIQNLTQLAIENTGKIGNALRKAGAVFENAYAPMVEKVTAMTPFQRTLQSYTDTIQGSDTAISNMDQVTGEVTSMKDAKKELFGDGTPENKGQIKEFEDSTKAISDAKKVEEDASKNVSQSPDIARSDLIKPET